MILKREILSKAEEWSVPANTVDKDYVLGRFLNSFFSFKENRNLFVFKGGTSLRKGYFSDYRFSEDLDFTLLDKSFLIYKSFFEKIAKQCEKESGIRFDVRKINNKQFKDEGKGYKCVIFFWGANHSQNQAPAPKNRWTTKIEIDISFDEEILFPVNHIDIIHPYSDLDHLSKVKIPVYSLEEILTEKIRAFYQRNYKAPRDYYDVWYLLNHVQFNDWNNIEKILKRKCTIKNKTIDTEIFNNEAVFKSISNSWNNSIAHHLPSHQLPELKEVWEYLKNNLFERFLKGEKKE